MNSETASAAPATWPVLSAPERRVLGVLIEKAQTTAGGSPLSLNSLVTGCNQKSNRDPLMNLSDAQVEDTVTSAQTKGLVTKIIGGRVEHWKHSLYDAWKVSKMELAVLGELLLRGPQTEGELRGRASRMEPIADVEALRGILKPLAERRLVVYLSPEGRRGTVLTHGFHAPEELDRLRTRHSVEATAPESAISRLTSPDGGSIGLMGQPEATKAEVDELRTQVAGLHDRVTNLEDQVREIKAGLGL